MLHELIGTIAGWGIGLVERFGYLGLFGTMALESAAVPIPSEVVVPFGGFLASSAGFSLWLVVGAVTLGNLTGSVVLYLVGCYGGRPLIERYGKYVLIHRDDIQKMDYWLQKYGGRVAFFSRLLPGVRTFSSLVIGASEIKFWVFFWYTALGSFLWNVFWAYLGFVTGNNWNILQPYVRKFEYFIAAAVIAGVIAFILKHVRRKKGKLILSE